MTLTFGKRKFFVGINSKSYSFFFARLQSLRSNVYAYGTMLNFIKFVLYSRGKQQHDGENKVFVASRDVWKHKKQIAKYKFGNKYFTMWFFKFKNV